MLGEAVLVGGEEGKERVGRWDSAARRDSPLMNGLALIGDGDAVVSGADGRMPLREPRYKWVGFVRALNSGGMGPNFVAKPEAGW